jgi:prepilin-type N-terminal cleavage/methylation domain-containing protein
MKEKGFTLVELLISLALFVISILLLFQLVLLAMRVNLVNSKRNNAVITAFSETEKVKAKRFEDIKDEFTEVYKDGTFYFVQKKVTVPAEKPELKEIKIGIYWGMETGTTKRNQFNECMRNNMDIEQCKSIPHHSYEYTFTVAEAL